ncbi:MAG: NAD-dependent epimerase/dehydratase family protein [Pirellulaceae bacterium]|nr:NAD-dependent epimerase/dehydratase family protein [Planctomycetales bacterium]
MSTLSEPYSSVNWNGRKILITGGAGQIGSNLLRRLLALGADVTVADNLWRGKRDHLLEQGRPLIDLQHRFVEKDLVVYENCESAVAGQELVFHLADVVAGINYVFGNQFSLFNTNMLMNSHMLRAAIAAGVKQYVYVGTACSYPAEKQKQLHPPPFKEEDVYPAAPESSYGWSKLMGEYECGLAMAENLIDVGVLRLHNVYGPFCEMSPERSQVIPALIRKAIRADHEEFIVWGSGNQRRSFVFVDDVVDALVAVVEKGMNQGVVQIGPGQSHSIRDVAETIVRVSGRDIDICFDTGKPEGDTDRTADWTRAKTLLGWSPRTELQEGIAKTFAWCHQQLSRQSC